MSNREHDVRLDAELSRAGLERRSPALPTRLLNVQTLRAYAALAVVFFHTEYTLGIGLRRPIGSFGVSIFFVISGFIMAMICDTDPRQFLARRIARIVPLYWVLTLSLFLLANASPRLLGTGTHASGASLLKSLFFIPYVTNGAYFPILFLGWSLNYEMYFYLLVAVALLIHKRHAALIASGGMIGFYLLLQANRVKGAAGFYAQPIIVEFMLGILCYYGFGASPIEWIKTNRRLLISGAIMAALVLIVAAMTVAGAGNALITGLASTILVFCGVLLDKAQICLRWPMLALLGDASYVMYLIHPYCQEILNRIAGRSFPILNTRTSLGMPVSMALTVLASIIAYRVIDRPLHLFFRDLLLGPANGKEIKLGDVFQRPAT